MAVLQRSALRPKKAAFIRALSNLITELALNQGEWLAHQHCNQGQWCGMCMRCKPGWSVYTCMRKDVSNSVGTAAKSLGNSGKHCCSGGELQVFHLPTHPCSLYLLSTESSLSETKSGVGCSETYSSCVDSCGRSFFPPFHPRTRYGDTGVHLISRAWEGAVM